MVKQLLIVLFFAVLLPAYVKAAVSDVIFGASESEKRASIQETINTIDSKKPSFSTIFIRNGINTGFTSILHSTLGGVQFFVYNSRGQRITNRSYTRSFIKKYIQKQSILRQLSCLVQQ
jgi:hypothetical protein